MKIERLPGNKISLKKVVYQMLLSNESCGKIKFSRTRVVKWKLLYPLNSLSLDNHFEYGLEYQTI